MTRSDQPGRSEEQFVSEPIVPEPGSFRTDLLSQGLASLPGGFTWRGRRYRIVECLDHSKLSAPEGHSPTGERYLRRQQFRVRLDTGQTATIYIRRQPPAGASRRAAKTRWFLLSISTGGTTGA